MKKTNLLFIFLFGTLLCSAQRISLQPSILDFHLGPSATQAQAITITNLSDKKLIFQAYLADWLRDSTGGHQYFRPDTLTRSCASWIQLNTSLIEVLPNQSQELLVRMQTPADSAGLSEMKWAMLFIQSVDEQDSALKSKQMQAQVKEVLRLGIHIYQTPPQINLFKAKALQLNALPADQKAFEFVMQNTGRTMLQCKTYLELTSVIDGKSYKSEKSEFPVFPDGVRKTKLKIPADLPKGKYSALAILDIGEDMPLEGIEQEIEVK